MNTLKITRKLIFLLLIALCVQPLQADDTEVFFADAKADESENQRLANVMILLDTSGSMRWCKRDESSGATWCSDEDNRRIKMLVDAFNTMIDTLPSGVRIGVSRFRKGTTDGGHVLYPVIDVNENSKGFLKAAVASTYDMANGDPTGGTPTSEAYYEMRRYMMGGKPIYAEYGEGYYDDNPNTLCVEEKDVDIKNTCRQVPVVPEQKNPLPAGETCDATEPGCDYEGVWVPDAQGECDSLDDPLCRIGEITGDWEDLEEGGCEESFDNCRAEIDFENIKGTCNETLDECRRNQGAGKWKNAGWSWDGCKHNERYERRGGVWNCEERKWQYQFGTKQYQTRSFDYEYSQRTYYEIVTREVCDQKTICSKKQDIVKDGKYISPMNMENECESNYVIVMTDGAPSAREDKLAKKHCSLSGSTEQSSYDCQEQNAAYLNSTENVKGRVVKTSNIGLYMGKYKSNMEGVSLQGGGQTYNADTADELAQAFIDELQLVDQQSRSVSSPGVAVNQMNRFQHLDELYYSVFEPEDSSYWKGNLKKYRLNEGKVEGVNGNAIDSNTGYFRNGSKSYWGSVVDGYDAKLGGARNQVADRTLYYQEDNASNGASLEEVKWSLIDGGDANSLPKEFFGLAPNATEETVNEFIERLKMQWGDPLHSVPILINYGTTSGSQDNIIYVSTNGGMLHAIDADDGSEKFAFMPYDLITRANEFTVDQKGLAANNDRQTYGLDGSWTVWRQSGASADAAPNKVMLFGGMRRGGNSYYALDVTDYDNPKFAWKISADDTGFEKLGQSWSTPTLTQIPLGASGTPTEVLVFGGGYSENDHDDQQDQARSSSGDAMGNAIYIVKASDGSLVWSASGDTVSKMKWSIPSAISVVDKDLDGIADHLYVGDLGGQIFRIDIDQSGSKDMTVNRIADFHGSGASGNRRFYEPPSVGYVEETTGKALYVSITSGYRSHPRDESAQDGVFVIRDTSAFSGSVPSTLKLNDSGFKNVGLTNTEETSDKGWYYFFDEDGEKGMSSPVIFNNKVRFTTYSPTGGDTEEDPCVVRYGRAFLHTVALKTGDPAKINNDGSVSTDRSEELKQSTPPPSPVIITDGDEVDIVVGTEVVGDDDPGDPGLRKRRWQQINKTQAGDFKADPKTYKDNN